MTVVTSESNIVSTDCLPWVLVHIKSKTQTNGLMWNCFQINGRTISYHSIAKRVILRGPFHIISLLRELFYFMLLPKGPFHIIVERAISCHCREDYFMSLPKGPFHLIAKRGHFILSHHWEGHFMPLSRGSFRIISLLRGSFHFISVHYREGHYI